MIKFYKIMSVPCCIRGIKKWTLRKTDKQLIQRSEMAFLRTVARYKRLDRKGNADIRAELNIFNLNERVVEYRNECEIHSRTKFQEYQLLQPRERISLGCPKKRWRYQSRKETNRHSLKHI